MHWLLRPQCSLREPGENGSGPQKSGNASYHPRHSSDHTPLCPLVQGINSGPGPQSWLQSHHGLHAEGVTERKAGVAISATGICKQGAAVRTCRGATAHRCSDSRYPSFPVCPPFPSLALLKSWAGRDGLSRSQLPAGAAGGDVAVKKRLRLAPSQARNKIGF